MRPNPPESIGGVTASLATGVMPELTTPWAQAQLRYCIGLLDSVAAEWDSGVENLVRENEALQRLCGLAANAAATRPRLAQQHPALQAAAALPPVPGLRISVLARRNNEFWEALLPVIEAVGANGSAAWAQAINAELQPLLRGYVADRKFGAAG